ncbi:MAG: PIG-L family deacetylase [Castellaniella sp.]
MKAIARRAALRIPGWLCLVILGLCSPAWAMASGARLPIRQPHTTALLQPASSRPVACTHGKTLSVVAHPDDDLLFMNPDQNDAIQHKQCVMVLYLTAGDRGEGLPYLQARERGLMAAYAAMARVANHWQTDGWLVGGHTVVRHTLKAAPRVQLIMLRIPDPWLGHGWGSLTPLSQLESVAHTGVLTYAPYPTHFDRNSLIQWLSAVIQAVQPNDIRLMDGSITIPYTQLCWRCRGHDHPDHIASARLVQAAIQAMPGPYRSQRYLGYPSQERPGNLDASQKALKTAVFLRYMANDPRYCARQSKCSRPRGPEAAWVWRQYRLDDDAAGPMPKLLLASPQTSLSASAKSPD